MQARSWVALALLALLAAFLAHDSADWQPDNRIANWVQRGQARDRQELLAREFGGDEFVLVRVEGLELEGPHLQWLDRLAERLEALTALGQILQPLGMPGAAAGTPRERLEAGATRPLAQALDLVDLDDSRGVRCDLLLAVRPEALPAERDEVATLLDSLTDEAAVQGLRLRSAGHPLLGSALDVESRRVDEVFAPLLVLLSLLVLSALFRSIPIALSGVLPAAIASTGARAALKHLGLPSNLILVALGPVLFVLVLASTLHLISAYRRERLLGGSPKRAAALAWSHLHRAALLAAATSALGFAVFTTSSVDAVADFGLSVAVSIAVATPLALLACRFVLSGIDHATTPLKGRASGTAFRRLALEAWRYRLLIRAAALLLFALAGVRSLDLGFASNAIDYFPDQHPVRDQFLSLEADGASLSTIELVVEDAPTGRSESLESGLNQLAEVHRAVGPEVVRRDLQSVLGELGASLALGPALVESGRHSADGRFTRWTVFTPTGDAAEMGEQARAIEAVAREWLAGEGGEVFTCGSLLGTLEMQVALTSTLATSLGLTLLVTTLLFLLVVRSPGEFGSALVVNLFPVAMVLLLNASTFAQIDPATVMVTAVVLGLAVDNTFHLLYAAGAYGRSRARRDRIRAFQTVGEPALASAIALALGFGVLALATFAPTARFGALVGAGVVTAAISDFVLLPALWLRPRATGSRRTTPSA